ncbi:MAG: Ig-like domain-containing protein [Neomegalonema sp.]|nr:Ig-like domain-containing protein [Neomegalonema sp.]
MADTNTNRDDQAQLADQRIIHADADAPIVLPSDESLLLAEFIREGDDLHLVNPNGDVTIIADYFTSASARDLIIAGAVVPGRVVGKLAQSAPSQLEPSQAGLETADAAPQAEPNAAAPADGTPIAEVTSVMGEVTVTRADGTIVRLHEGDLLFEDDVLVTGDDGALGMTFIDGMTFSLGEDARLILDEFAYDAANHEGGGLFSVLRGTFSFVSGGAAHTAPDALMIETPSMTIGVRGTKVVAEVAADGSTTRVALLAEEDGVVGKIMVSTQGGQELIDTPNRMVEALDAFAPPSAQREISSSEIFQYFDGALDALPAPTKLYAREPVAASEAGASGSQSAAPQTSSQGDAPVLQKSPSAPNSLESQSGASLLDMLQNGEEAILAPAASEPTEESEATAQAGESGTSAENLLEALDADFETQLLEDPAKTNAAPTAPVVEETTSETVEETPEPTAPIVEETMSETVAQTPEPTAPVVEETVSETVAQTPEPTTPVVEETVSETVEETPEPTTPVVEETVSETVEETPEPTTPVVEETVSETVEESPETTAPVVEETVSETVEETPEPTTPVVEETVSETVAQTPEPTAPVVEETASETVEEPPEPTEPVAEQPPVTVETEEETEEEAEIEEPIEAAPVAEEAPVSEEAPVAEEAPAQTPVAPVNSAPVFTSASTASVAEDALETDVIYTASASDDDDISGSLSFSLADDAGGRFTIDAASGAVSLASGQTLDFESATSHAITIQASDGVNTTDHTVAISVADANDSAPVFTSASTASVAEDALETDVIYTASANDADTTGESLSFSLADDAGGRFTIDATSGAVSLASGQTLDFESATSHAITIQASDGVNTTDHTVAISVADVAEVSQANLAPALSALAFASFNGTDTILNAGDPGASNDALDIGTGDMTIEAWFYYGGDTGDRLIVSKGSATGLLEGFSVGINGDQLFGYVNTNGLSSAVTNIQLTEEGWHHVAIVIDQQEGSNASTITGYLDGSNEGWGSDMVSYIDEAFTAPSAGVDSGRDLWIGGGEVSGTPSDLFEGGLADIRIWSTARAQSEIVQTMHSALSGSEQGLVANWKLDSAELGTDSTGNYNASVSGSTGVHSGSEVTLNNQETASGQLIATDPDGDALTYSVLEQGSLGSAIIDPATGEWTYDPSDDVTGVDTVRFQVSDGTNSTELAMTITVEEAPVVNSAPVIAAASGLDFSAGDGAVETSSADHLDVTGNGLTVEAWFYYDGSASSDETIISKGNTTDDDLGYSIRMDGTELVVRVNKSNGSAAPQMAAQSIDLGTDAGWKHVAMVIDQDAGSVTGYLDGSNSGWTDGHDGVGDASFSGNDIDGDDMFLIGAADDGSSYDKWGNLQVSDVRVWGTARTAEEIQANMARALDGSETDLLSNWKLDEGSGTTLDDIGANDADGTFTGVDPVWVSTASATTEVNVDAHGRVSATDADGDALTFSVAAQGAHGTAAIDAQTGAWEYTPDANFIGTDAVSYQVTDGMGGSDIIAITVNVV